MFLKSKRWRRLICGSFALLILISSLCVPAFAADEGSAIADSTATTIGSSTFEFLDSHVPAGVPDDVRDCFSAFLTELDLGLDPAYLYISNDLVSQYFNSVPDLPSDSELYSAFPSCVFSNVISADSTNMVYDYASVYDLSLSDDVDLSVCLSYYLVFFRSQFLIDGVTYSSLKNTSYSVEDALGYSFSALSFISPATDEDDPEFVPWVFVYQSNLVYCDLVLASDDCLVYAFVVPFALDLFTIENFECETDTGESCVVSFNAEIYQLGFSSSGVSPFAGSSSGSGSGSYDGVMGSILSVFVNVGSWIVGVLGVCSGIFYTPDSGLTVVGVLAVSALAVSVILLLIALISRFLKFR